MSEENEVSVKRYDWNTGDESATGEHVMHKDYAALETLCQQQHEALKRWRVHSIWIPAIGYSMAQEAEKIIAAYDALFPKAGGAK